MISDMVAIFILELVVHLTSSLVDTFFYLSTSKIMYFTCFVVGESSDAQIIMDRLCFWTKYQIPLSLFPKKDVLPVWGLGNPKFPCNMLLCWWTLSNLGGTCIQYFCFQADEVGMMTFVLYMLYFPLIVLMFFLNCFGDATPKYLNFNRGEVRSQYTS